MLAAQGPRQIRLSQEPVCPFSFAPSRASRIAAHTTTKLLEAKKGRGECGHLVAFKIVTTFDDMSLH